MQTVSMQNLEQSSYWQEKRFKSGHWYNLYNPVISVELTEFADRVGRNNDAVQEIQMDLTVHQHRVPAWNENLLMSLSDGLLRAVQHWVTSRRLSMKTRCYLTLQTVEPITLPLTKCLGVLTDLLVILGFPVSPMSPMSLTFCPPTCPLILLLSCRTIFFPTRFV